MGKSSVILPGNDLIVTETISSDKFSIFLVKSSIDGSECIVKAFNSDSASHLSYLREKQMLSSIDHPNIIHYISDSQFKISIPNRNSIVMEYAPYGDFFNLIMEVDLKDEKLVRTYFRQLIGGIEHLHSRRVAHLDIKLENLLLGKDFLLKIADFDLAQSIYDKNVLSRGTANYRAPELRTGNCQDYKAADVFSAGVCLFALMSRAFAFIEEGDEAKGKLQRYDEYLNKNHKFWKGMEKLTKKQGQFSESFRELLNGMWLQNPSDRFTLKDVKSSEWYNGPVYSQEELQEALQNLLDH